MRNRVILRFPPVTNCPRIPPRAPSACTCCQTAKIKKFKKFKKKFKKKKNAWLVALSSELAVQAQDLVVKPTSTVLANASRVGTQISLRGSLSAIVVHIEFWPLSCVSIESYGHKLRVKTWDQSRTLQSRTQCQLPWRHAAYTEYTS